MNVLAIETATRPGSLAIQDSAISKRQSLDGGRPTTTQFAAVIDTLLREANWSPQSVDLVAVCVGPGSFTGLRIGVTAAKTFAYATGASVLAVDTLELTASQVDEPGPIVAVLDALRGQVYSATYRRESGQLQCSTPTRLQTVTEWLAGLQPGQRITGLGLGKLADSLPAGVTVVDPKSWRPRAEELAKLAADRFVRGERHDAWRLQPAYFRPSAAEEKAAKRTRP